MTKSVWLHDYTSHDSTFGPNFDWDLISDNFDEIFINNTDNLAVNQIRRAHGKGLKVYQWILDPINRDRTLEVPLKDRDGFILDIEPFFINKDFRLDKLISKWKLNNTEKIFLCVPAPDFIFTYKIRGYELWIKEHKHIINKFDRVYVMEYVSYPTTFFKPVWLIKHEISYLEQLTGRKITPIFSIYDWQEQFAKSVINTQIKKYEKLKETYPNHSIFAWSDPLVSYLYKVQGTKYNVRD